LLLRLRHPKSVTTASNAGALDAVFAQVAERIRSIYSYANVVKQVDIHLTVRKR